MSFFGDEKEDTQQALDIYIDNIYLELGGVCFIGPKKHMLQKTILGLPPVIGLAISHG